MDDLDDLGRGQRLLVLDVDGLYSAVALPAFCQPWY